MKNIKLFKLFENNTGKIVYRGLNRDYNNGYDGVQYYTENISYAKVFGNNIKSFHLSLKDVMDLDKWNGKLSKETRSYYGGNLFTIHSTYMDKESKSYGYKGLRDILLTELNQDEFFNFQKEFKNARIIKGRDSGNESQVVYAVRDKNLIQDIS